MDMSSVVETKPKEEMPEMSPGDTVRVKLKIIEGERERSQTFEGVVIRLRPGGAGASFTVRKVFQGVGVERTFPLHSPRLESIELLRYGKVRRAKLYYIRDRVGKSAKVAELIRKREDSTGKT